MEGELSRQTCSHPPARNKPDDKPLVEKAEEAVLQSNDGVGGEGESGGEEEGRPGEDARVPESPGVSGESVETGEGSVFPEGGVEKQVEGGPENEFMLDGFDFSTGVRLVVACQTSFVVWGPA